jgi:hypothetical protein
VGPVSVEGEIIAMRQALSSDDLLNQIAHWESAVRDAKGFVSAKEAALQLKWYVLEARRRGFPVENKQPIRRGHGE